MLATADDLDDDALWSAFHERTLPSSSWTHAAHVRMAWMHLARYPLDEAHVLMRVGIIRLNAAHGLVETPQRGYHETITRVWLVLVAAARAIDPASDSRAFLARHALERDLPLRYYSRDRLFSLQARAMFVAPDLAELPPSSERGPSRDKWQGYREVVDKLVDEVENGQGAIGPRRARDGLWNQSATEHAIPDQHAINQLLARLSPTDRDVIAGMLKDAFVGGIHTALVWLHAFQVPPFENGYEGTPFHDFMGRLIGWPWPERPRE